MKTCLLVNNAPQPGRSKLAKLGGGGRSLLSLLKELPTLGWRAHVVVPGEGQFTDALRDLQIGHTVFPYTLVDWHKPFRTVREFSKWQHIIRDVRPDVIHGNGFDLSRSFGPSASLRNIPFISHIRFPMEAQGIRWVLHRFPKPNAFIFNSHAMKKLLWPRIHDEAPAALPFVVHNPVDLDSFSPSPEPPSPPYRIGIVANFAPFKRHEDFLRMAARIVQQRQNVEFWVVGDDTEGGNRRETLEQLARDLAISDYVKFLGHRMDIPEIMRQLHILVVPSRFEPFGRVVIEAMACGRPVIGSRDGGIPEIIEHGDTGILADVGNIDGFVEAAVSLIGDNSLWERLSVNAAVSARARFSATAHAERVAAIYDQIISHSTEHAL